ncbi:MAG: hypothetical protein M3256_04585, partial [Actinomycetota bacterium]|nr:hypothetical protein [Actinomycetota bacterium]
MLESTLVKAPTPRWAAFSGPAVDPRFGLFRFPLGPRPHSRCPSCARFTPERSAITPTLTR